MSLSPCHFAGGGSSEHRLLGFLQAVPERAAHAEEECGAVAVDAGTGRVGSRLRDAEGVADDGAAALGCEDFAALHGGGELAGRQRHGVESEAAADIARKTVQLRLAAGERRHGVDALGCLQEAHAAGVRREHRLHADLGRDVVPQRLAAAN